MDRRIDPDWARRDAKALLKAARAGDREARARMRADREPRLADAQHAVARELGEVSWPALMRRVEAELSAEVDELLELAYAGERDAALARAGSRAAGRIPGDAMIRAAREGRADVVDTLLELRVDPNAREPATGATALHVAARAGQVGVVDRLVTWVPVDVNARDAAGSTALWACLDGGPYERKARVVIAKMLISAGARPEPGMPEELAAWARNRPTAPPSGAHGEAAWAADAAMFEYLSTSPLAEVRPAGDGFAFVTGLFDNAHNGVVCSRLEAETADADIAGLLAWLDGRGVPAQWLVAATTEPPDLRERLERSGCQPERMSVYMTADVSSVDLVDRERPAELEIVSIRDEAQLAAAFAAVDERDQRELALLASLGLTDDRPLRHYAAHLDGRPVGIASAFTTGTTVLATDLEVASANRRRGIGCALFLHVLREAAAAGCTLALLGPTKATVPFYEALGFTLWRFPPDRGFYPPIS